MGNDPPSICMEAVIEKKARRGCEKRPRRRGSVGMEILLNQLRIFSLRQRGHQQYTRFCRVEESATSPGWLSSGGTTPLPVREARTTTMPACCAF